MAKDDSGWSEWCRVMATDFQRAASRTRGARSANLRDLAAHYDTQAVATATVFTGNKRSNRRAAMAAPLLRGDKDWQ